MLSASAPHGDRQIATVRRFVDRNAAGNETGNIVEEFGDCRLRVQKRGDRCIQSTQVFKSRIPIGVGQGTGVKHEVDVCRQTVFEAERFEQNGKATTLTGIDALADGFAQLVNAGLRGIQHQIRGVRDWTQQAAFFADGLTQ